MNAKTKFLFYLNLSDHHQARVGKILNRHVRASKSLKSLDYNRLILKFNPNKILAISFALSLSPILNIFDKNGINFPEVSAFGLNVII